MTTPRQQPLIAWTGPLGALLALGAAGVVARDAVVALGWSAGDPWVAGALERLDGLAPSAGVGAIGVALVVVGVLLATVAAGRGRRRHLAVRAAEGPTIWVHRDTIGELVRDLADRSAGVVDTDLRWRGRTVVLRIEHRSDAPSSGATVESALAPVLTALPQVRLRLRTSEVTP